MSRIREIEEVTEAARHRWLAGQLDEVEMSFVSRIDKLTDELAATRKVLTGILISIIVALVSFPVGVLIARLG